MNPMIRNKDILNCLPLLASILGRNYGVTVQIGGDSAYTNGNEIHIPSLPLNCDKEMVWLARGYIDHESAHIRFTDFEVLQEAKLDPVTHHLWNSIEDWRVEERLSSLYPGCRQHFQWLARKIFVEDTDKRQEEAGDKPASSILKYVLLSVRSWSVPEIREPLQHVIKRMDGRFQGLRPQIDSVISRIQKSCRSTQDAIDYACEIAAIVKAWEPAVPPQQDGGLMYPPDLHATETIESADIQQAQREIVPEQEVSQDATQLPNAEQSSHANSCTESDEESQPSTQTDLAQEGNIGDPTLDIANLFASKADDLPKSLGEQIASTLQGGQPANQDASVSVATVGSIGHCTVSQDEKENALRASVALRSRLQGLLQANLRKSVGISRRGSLSTKHLYRLAIGNPRVFASQEERQGLNTAVHILVDVSSSMSGASIQLARQSCYAVVKALSGIKGINPAVTALPAADYNENTVVPLLKHGERLPPYLSVKANGSTPLAEALWWVMQTMLHLKESRKIILILTDGIPNSVPNAQYAIHVAKKIGYEIYGIGIMTNSINQLLPKTSLPIYNINELTEATFKLLQLTLFQRLKTNIKIFR